MMKRKILIVICALLLLSAVVFSACNKKTDGEIGTIYVGTSNAIERAERDEYNFDVITGGLSQLAPVSQNADGTFSPLLCNYETADGKAWSFTVIDKMKWHDGVAVTAADIVFTLQYADKFDGAFNFIGGQDTSGNAVSAKYSGYEISADGATVKLTLATPNVRELGNMTTLRIMPKHLYTAASGEMLKSVSAEASRVGCGPYIFSAFDVNAGTVSFTANESYPAGKPNADKIVIKQYGTADTLNLALAHGEIDMIFNYSQGLGTDAVAFFKKFGGVVTEAVAANNLPAVLVFNNGVAPFNDENLRKAVSYAVDYKKFAQLFTNGGGVPHAGILPQSVTGYAETALLLRDLAAAKQYLAKSGYVDADINADGYHTKNGVVLAFKLTVRSDKPLHLRCAELLKSNLGEIGIKVELDSLSASLYNAKTSNKFSGNNPSHQAAIMGFTAYGVNGGAGLATTYMDGKHAVQGGAQISDAEFSGIIAKLNAAATPEEYDQAAKECQNYYAAHTPAIALYQDYSVQAHSARLTNFSVDGTFFLFNVKSWYTVKLA